MSTEFERFKRLYAAGRITERGLDKAVSLGLITAEEKILIMTSNETVSETE